MSAALTKVVELLGFSAPFLYAGATYGCFLYLDKKASGPAKKALTEWLQSVKYDKQQVGSALLEAFDRLYGYPPLSLRTLGRVIVASIIIQAVLLAEFVPEIYLLMARLPTVRVMVPMLIMGVLIDFGSVTFVRRMLILLKDRPFLSLGLGLITGLAVILLVAFLQSVLFPLFAQFPLQLPNNLSCAQDRLEECLRGIDAQVLKQTEEQGVSTIVYSFWIAYVQAFVIHAWLPLFALSVAAAKLVNYSVGAARWMQWFIKQGRNHPFEAVGLVAAVIVFAIAASISVIGRAQS